LIRICFVIIRDFGFSEFELCLGQGSFSKTHLGIRHDETLSECHNEPSRAWLWQRKAKKQLQPRNQMDEKRTNEVGAEVNGLQEALHRICCVMQGFADTPQEES
jgi:hypothetical protein